MTTQGGNFPHFLMGHRRFLYGGHAKTIIPDKRRLVVLLQDMGLRYSPSLNFQILFYSFDVSDHSFRHV